MSESRGRRLSLIHPQQVDRIPVSKQIIFHDAEGIPRGAISEAQCEALVKAGHGWAVRSRKGKIKRVSLSEFAQVRPSGLIATTLEEGDQLGWVRLTLGGQDIIIVTEQGQAARYSEDEVRAMGRTAAGVGSLALRILSPGIWTGYSPVTHPRQRSSCLNP